MTISTYSHVPADLKYGWFGMNKHKEAPKVADVYSEITGLKVGKVVEHWTGQQDAGVKTDCVIAGPEESERIWGLPLNDFRRLLYESKREMGMSHEEAIARTFRDGKIEA